MRRLGIEHSSVDLAVEVLQEMTVDHGIASPDYSVRLNENCGTHVATPNIELIFALLLLTEFV